VHVEEDIASYLVDLIEHTCDDSHLKLGVSPRGAILLFAAAKASAVQRWRDFVLPDDVQRMAPHVLTHRFILTSKAKYSGAQQADVIADTLSAVAVPT
jgi:MoxR-like ATPase